MSSRALLNSFMLCPRLRAKSGNFFAPKRTRTMRSMIKRSGPPRFPIPNARIFITILNWSSPWFIPERRSNLVYKKRAFMHSLELEYVLLREAEDYNTRAWYSTGSTGPWKQPPRCMPISRFSYPRSYGPISTASASKMYKDVPVSNRERLPVAEDYRHPALGMVM